MTQVSSGKDRLELNENQIFAVQRNQPGICTWTLQIFQNYSHSLTYLKHFNYNFALSQWKVLLSSCLQEKRLSCEQLKNLINLTIYISCHVHGFTKQLIHINKNKVYFV